jgi:hypothetical protein
MCPWKREGEREGGREGGRSALSLSLALSLSPTTADNEGHGRGGDIARTLNRMCSM